MTTVKTQIENGKMMVSSPFNSDLVKRARAMGGQWDAHKKVWVYDARNEGAVRALYRDVYGVDGSETDSISVRLRLLDGGSLSDRREAYYLNGVPIARAYGRDSGASVAPGVIVEQGGFTSAGSAKNWYTLAQPGTVILLRDVGANWAKYEHPEWSVEVVAAADNTDQLRAELARLEERVAAIKKQLGE